MEQKQPKKQTEKVYRSMDEFMEHVFPNFYPKELMHEKVQDPDTFGTGLVEELLKNVGREFRKQNPAKWRELPVLVIVIQVLTQA